MHHSREDIHGIHVDAFGTHEQIANPNRAVVIQDHLSCRMQRLQLQVDHLVELQEAGQKWVDLGDNLVEFKLQRRPHLCQLVGL